MNQLLKQYTKHLIVLLGFIVVSLAYFSPVLQGKKIFQSDIVQYKGMAKQQIDFRSTSGVETYWTNAAFGGMPTYQLGAKYPHNYLKHLDLSLRGRRLGHLSICLPRHSPQRMDGRLCGQGHNLICTWCRFVEPTQEISAGRTASLRTKLCLYRARI